MNSISEVSDFDFRESSNLFKLQTRRQHLVFSSVGDRSDCFESWTDNDESRTYDLWVAYYGESETQWKRIQERSDMCFRRKGAKFQNFSFVWKRMKSFIQNTYDYVWIPDDDIEISSDGIERCFALARKYKLWVCGPSFTDSHRAKITHSVTKHIPGRVLHFTNFVEVNVPLFDVSILPRIMRVYPYELIGWGIDFLIVWTLGIHRRNRYAIIDAVQCINPKDNEKMSVVTESISSSREERELYKIPGAKNRGQIWADVSKRIHCPFWLYGKVYKEVLQ